MLDTLFAQSARDAAVDALHSATAIYTSRHVVDGLLDQLGWPCAGATLLDPSSGDGSFLIAAIARLPLSTDDRALALTVRGVEIHPGAVLESRRAIAEHLVSRGWSPTVAAETAQEMVQVGDFLAGDPAHATADIVAGNPPYLRWANIPDHFQDLYRTTLPAHALADLLHAFLDRCAAVLPPDGRIGFVTSDRWLTNETAAPLREIIGRRLGITHLKRLPVDSSFYRPKLRRRGSPPRIHPVALTLEDRGRARLALSRAPLSPDAPAPAAPDAPTLGDIAIVRISPWVGPAGIFLIDRKTASRLPPDHLIPAVDTDDFSHDDEMLPPKRFAIMTQADRPPHPAIARHLQATLHAMPPRGRRDPWWLPPETITIPTDQAMLVIPRIARRLRVIAVPAGTISVQHNISIVAAKPPYTLEQIKAALLHPATQARACAMADPLENGFRSFKTRVLRALPLSFPV